MSRVSLARIWICAALAVAATATTNLKTYGTSFRLPAENTRARDLAHAFDARFRTLRPALAGTRAVGYWSDDPDGGLHFIAQYAIAPVILEAPAGQALLLVDIRKGGKLATQPPVEGYVVLKEFGPGLVLLKKHALPTAIATTAMATPSPSPTP